MLSWPLRTYAKVLASDAGCFFSVDDVKGDALWHAKEVEGIVFDRRERSFWPTGLRAEYFTEGKLLAKEAKGEVFGRRGRRYKCFGR